MAGTRRFQVTLGPFSTSAERLVFRLHCEHPGLSPRVAVPPEPGAQDHVRSHEATNTSEIVRRVGVAQSKKVHRDRHNSDGELHG